MDVLAAKRQEYGYSLYEPSYDNKKYIDQQIYKVNLYACSDIDTAKRVFEVSKSLILDYNCNFDEHEQTGALVLAFGSPEDAERIIKMFSDVKFRVLDTRDQINEKIFAKIH